MIDVHKLGEKYKLTESEMLILEHIINNIEESQSIGVRGVAKKCFSSGSVVMSLSKKLGYKGFVHMLYKLEQQVKSDNYEETNEKLEKSFCGDYDCELLENFSILLNSSKKIFVHGLGFSRIISEYLRDKLIVLGHCAMSTEYIGTLENSDMEDSIFISISKSGETLGAIALCKIAKKSGIKVISFTGNPENTIQSMSDIHFLVKDSNPLDDRNIKENDFFSNTIAAFEFILARI